MEILRETVLDEIEKLKREGKSIQEIWMILHANDCPLARKAFGNFIEVVSKKYIDSNYLCQCSCKMSKSSLLPYIEFEKPKTQTNKNQCITHLFYINYDVRKYIENLLKPILVY